MDSQKYLESYGWTPGEALQKGGLKKPILVSHKFDLKGIGHGANESVSWWETIFDGQLKSLEVNKKGEFKKDEEVQKQIEREELKKQSPLYQMFVKGEVLVGTVDKNGKRVVDMKKNSSVSESKKRSAAAMESNDAGEGEQLLFFYSSDEESDRDDKSAKRKRKEEKILKKAKKAAKKAKKVAKKEKKAARAAKRASKASS